MESVKSVIQRLKKSQLDEEIEALLDEYFVVRKAEEMKNYKRYSQEAIQFDGRIDWNSIDMKKLQEQYARVIRN